VKCLIVGQEAEVSKSAIAAGRMKCDGATDDTVEFQRAIDAAQKSAKRLVLPSGTCIVTSTIAIPDHI
jgi:polygalacturonase